MKKLTCKASLIIALVILVFLISVPRAFAAEYRWFIYFEGLPANYIETGWQGYNYYASPPIPENLEVTLYGYPKTIDGQTYTSVGYKDASGSITPATGDNNRVTFTLDSDTSITWIYKKTYQVSFNLDAMGQHLWEWGLNRSAQAGCESSGSQKNTTPVEIGVDDDWLLVDGGDRHSVGIRSDGTLWAWGCHNEGQIGIGDVVAPLIPVEVLPGTTWITAAAGVNHTVAIKSDGTLWAWGYNGEGQIGQGNINYYMFPTQVGQDDRWVSVSAGTHTMAIRSDGTLWAWGRNNWGQLGIGTQTNELSPVQVTADLDGDNEPDSDWATVSAGWYHTLAIKTDGSLWAWGTNREGQLGIGKVGFLIYPPSAGWLNAEFEYKETPVRVVTGAPATWKDISAGLNYSMAIRSDGTLWAWGSNAWGQLGIGSTPEGWTWNPQTHHEYQLTPPLDWISAENYANMLGGYNVVTNDVVEYVWVYSTFSSTPYYWLGVTDFYINQFWYWVTARAQSEAGYLLWRSGEPNDDGGEQVAMFSQSDKRVNDVPWPCCDIPGVVERPGRPSPVQVGPDTDWVSVSAGGYHTLAIKSDSTLWAWGQTTYGRVGVEGIDEGPGYEGMALSPYQVQVGEENKWRLATAGGYHSLAIRGDKIELVPYLGSRMILEGTEITGSARVMPNPDGSDAYNLINWTADPVMSGSSFTAGFNLDFTWTYMPPRIVDIAFSGNTPQSVRNSAAALPEEGENWFAEGQDIHLHVEPLVEDPNNPGTFYMCQGWERTIYSDPPESESGTDCEFIISPLSYGSDITWNYAQVRSLATEFEGLPEHLRDDPRFDPRGPDAGWDPSEPVWLVEGSDQTLTPPTEIFDEGGKVQYVLDLESSSGMGDLPSGQDLENPFNVSQDSGVTWHYKKQLRLRVEVAGLDNPSDAGASPFQDIYYEPNSFVSASALAELDLDQDGNVDETCHNLVVLSGTTGSPPPTLFLTQDNRKELNFLITEPTDLVWNYKEAESWTIGQAIIPPADANGNTRPQSDSQEKENSFYWDAANNKLYAVRPLSSVVLTWQNSATGDWDVTQPGYNVWLTSGLQKHIVGAPAHLEPAGGENTFEEIHYSEGYEDPNTGIFIAPPMEAKLFNPPNPGRSLLRFSSNENNPPLFVTVNSIRWDDEPVDEKTVDIGKEIISPKDPDGNNIHDDPEGKNGYVLFEKAYYDGTGDDKAYDRSTREGQIFPVNKTTEETPTENKMVVVWYETGAAGVGWSIKPVQYICEWPDPTDGKIVIASGNGSEPLAEYEYLGELYYQPDSEQPGYNPNEEHALLLGNKVFAIRADLNSLNGVTTSEPYVLLKYHPPETSAWDMKVFKVEAVGTDDQGKYHDFNYPIAAGQPIVPLMPLDVLPKPAESQMNTGEDWYHRDHKGGHWAKASNGLTGIDQSSIVMHWYYPLQAGFYYPLHYEDGSPVTVGSPIPFLNGGNSHQDVPQDVTYLVGWPEEAKVLKIGETLTEAKYGLPDIVNWASGQVIFDENAYQGGGILARLIDPFTERSVALEELPDSLTTENVEGRLRFPDLPFSLRSRLFYDPINKKLIFKGVTYNPGIGETMVLPNIMTIREKNRLKAFEPFWQSAVADLFRETRNYITGSQKIVGLPMALSAGAAAGEGYVVLAENDDESLGAAPVALHVIKVAGGPYRGEIKVITPDNVFDEKLTLRHSGDFGGEPEKFYFAWYYKPDNTGLPPDLPEDTTQPSGWVLFDEGQGLNDITIEGAGKLTLSDNWFMVNYYYGDQPDDPGIAYPALCPETEDPLGPLYWSDWAGAPGGETAQLAPGWIKRVVADLNPLDARVKDFRNYAISTDVSVVTQLGERYEGDIALSGTPENLNSLGLIEAYETIMGRAKDFSIDAAPPADYGPVNNAILNAGTRIADFYTLLGNEAYADAQDPTIGFDTKSGALGTMASSIFAFQNQLPSLLEEELVLLRGRDNSMSTTRARPIYNRLAWNFTQGDGELAYVQTYNIVDKDESGVVDELDAKIIYPQGHGDAWGHYLTGMKVWYSLLRHEYFTWEPRIESVLVGGAPIPVDYLDERKFAQTASAKARAGAEIVDLTYRKSYVDDPAGQWQGYKDTDIERAWGVDGWARRAGQGAYFDWAVANAMLSAEDPVPTHTGIQKIDRTTVPELRAIASEFWTIQNQADQSDEGLNPIGLAKGVVPFDIDPYLLTPFPGVSAKTHFEQIYDRAVTSLVNARTVFDYATQYTLMLRSNDDTLVTFKREVESQELNYTNQLIEIFGYPYDGDIGPGGTYKSGYNGPDLFHFMYVDLPDLTGESLVGETITYTYFFEFNGVDLEQISDPLIKGLNLKPMPNGTMAEIKYDMDSENPWLSTPAGWGQRRAPGKIQVTLSELIKAHASYRRGLTELEGQLGVIQAAADILEAKHGIRTNQILVMNSKNERITNIEEELREFNQAKLAMRRIGEGLMAAADNLREGGPLETHFQVGTSGLGPHVVVDTEINPGNLISAILDGIAQGIHVIGDILEEEVLRREHWVAEKERERDYSLFVDDARFEVQQMVKELETMESDVRAKLQELYALREVIHQSFGRYRAALAKGERLLSEREVFRKRAAADVQDYRYQDMGFRIFRNDAVQKYRSTFELASRYAYLAATAYDYETNLLGSESGSGREFLTDIVKQRSPGVIVDGQPMVEQRGLADPLARLNQNFQVYKGQLGFNNPQTETNRFSLRRELFRFKDDSDLTWRAELEYYRVSDLWKFPPFKRFCRPFADEALGAQPGIIIPFSTQIKFGQNFFGWPLGAGDSAYDPSNFATKIRSVGVWFTGYENAGLSSTPRVYLVPVGADVLRLPSANDFTTREWYVVDQKLPVPFPVSESELSEETWIPVYESLSDVLGGIRRFSSFRAFPDLDYMSEAEIIESQSIMDTRLVGRSVWNTQWLLIIPGGTLLADPEAGLDAFIDNITDIKLFFQTYSYSGN